jgi:three-Cys-motif partner protein
MPSSHLTRWSCHRLECLTGFITGYGKTLKNDGCFVDLFAGPAALTCTESACRPECLGVKLLKDESPFTRLIFLTRNPAEASALKTSLKPLDKTHAVEVFSGNCMHEEVLMKLFDYIPRSAQSVALVNPPGYSSLRWSVIKKLALHGADWQGHKMDLCIIFPLEMALLRNILRPACRNSINRLYGSEAWQEIKREYGEHKLDLGQMRKKLVDLFKTQLKQLGYKHVEDIEPARFTNPPYYHVIWASGCASRLKELRDAWGKERFLSCEMFHG